MRSSYCHVRRFGDDGGMLEQTILNTHALRLKPGDDLRLALETAFSGLMAAQGVQAACVISAVGSLSRARLRYVGQADGAPLTGDMELLTLSGTFSPAGAHLHASVADAQGRVLGGHVLPGCTVRTTAEVVLALLPDWQFSREPDAQTGFKELVIQRRAR